MPTMHMNYRESDRVSILTCVGHIVFCWRTCIIEESGGSGFSISKEEMEKIVRQKKEEEKNKRKAKWKPLDDMDWRH